MEEKKLIRTSEVAALLGVSEKTVRRWSKKGTLHPERLPGSKLLFFKKDEITQMSNV